MARLFAVCTPGLEPFLAGELNRLGLPTGHPSSQPEDFSLLKGPEDEVGGVEFRGSLPELYRANLHLRTASRVLMQLGRFYADTFSDLRRRAKRLPWENHLRPGRAVSLRIACHRSRLFHSGAVAERIREAMADRLGSLPPVQNFEADEGEILPQLIIVRLVENRCAIHVDSSGALLYRRGYRQATGKAPLRETLAAGILLASGWDTLSPLLDPFCGSGSIAIEAARLARRIPPGGNRKFAFMDWPNFDSEMWRQLLAEIGPIQRVRSLRIMASDRDAGVLQDARANAERAGVAEAIEFSRRSISAIHPPREPGWVVTNPPYGVRLGSTQDLRLLYARFGKVMRAKCPGWKIALLCSSAQLPRATGLKFDSGILTWNGGLKVRLMRGSID
jgi:putative N6-adenine-specific DNA methylase